jgi:hypothetical protein
VRGKGAARVVASNEQGEGERKGRRRGRGGVGWRGVVGRQGEGERGKEKEG